MISEVIQDVSECSEVKEQEQEEALRMWLAHQENELSTQMDRMAQLNDPSEGSDEVQGEMDYVYPDFRDHIEAQLLSASPIFEFGETALHRAAKRGLEEDVALLLAACPFLIDLPGVCNNGLTAFQYAVKYDYTAIVAQFLAANPALINARTWEDWTALHLAAENGAAAVVTQLLAINPALIDARTDEGDTALHLAVLTGQVELVTQLLAVKPALIDAKTNDGRTVLHNAIDVGKAAVVALILAANPALIDATTNDGRTALYEAFWSGKIELAKQLLAAKPSLIEEIINGDDSWTALQRAVRVDHEEAVKRLLTMHPEMIHNTSRDRGWTVFHEAAYYGSNKVMPLLLATVPQPNFEQLLLRRSDWLGLGETALHVAAQEGNSNIVAQLLAACPSLVDVLDRKGQTCLHSAASSSREPHKSIVEELLAFKPALIYAVDAQGNTILHSICRAWRLDDRVLIEKVWKLNPDALHAVNRDGNTPFYLALFAHSEWKVIDVLQWGVTIDEIVNACKYRQSYVERFKPLMELQCEELVMKLLPDLVAIVFEYVGFPVEGMN